METRSRSPPLPTFGIRDLSGPTPGLISITKRQYESTIKSQPDAKLLYLDDDDGELITVGSALELGERLSEPVLKYTRGSFTETYNPVNDCLVHVFDINHSSGSLAEWRDHEAYSSKNLRRPSLSSKSACDSLPAEPPVVFLTGEHADLPIATAMKDSNEQQAIFPAQGLLESRGHTQEEEAIEIDTFDVLGGVEKHLNGLASVLQIAADTMQKAANKTRETDATVVEDILKGVRDILIEVGSFGVEVFKELNRPLDEAPCTESEDEGSAVSVQMQDASSKQLDISSSITENSSCLKPEPPTPSETFSMSDHSSTDTRVKFAFVEDETDESASLIESSMEKKLAYADESDEDDISEYDDANPNIEESQIFKPAEPQALDRPVNPSILDDSSEDADFTARYPPLHTVRRARSTIEKSSYSRDEPVTQVFSPFAVPRRGGKSWEDSICAASRQANSEACRKPLPGAWPDIKYDAAPTLPILCESSGEFFNRMTGRTPDKQPQPPSGIHRANTTTSSNPASRLNGPFDPGFAYEPSKTSHMSLRSHRRPYFPIRDQNDQLTSRIYQSPATKALARLEAKRSIPNFACSARRGPISLVDERPSGNSSCSAPSFTKFDSHRAIKHHRSVPHFQPYVPSPINKTTQLPTRSVSTRSNWVSQLSMPPADYLTGNNMPSVHLCTYPAVAPQSSTPSPLPQAPPILQPRSSTPSPVFAPSSNLTGFNSPLRAFQSGLLQSPSLPYGQDQSSRMLERDHSVSSSPSPPSAISAVSSIEEEGIKNKFDVCVEKLQMCGFGIDDDNLKDRLHVYAVAANGDVEEAVDMIEEDRRVSCRFE